jgi:hypothetical protein
MATVITDIITNLYALVSGSLTTYNELRDPYDIENNTELFLKNGFAIAVGDGTNEEAQSTSCHRWTRRNFTITLTNKITTTRENKAAIKTLQKDLMEDQETIIQAIYDDSTLSGKVVDCKYVSDTGIQYLDVEQIKYFRIDITIEVLYIKQV